MASLTSSSSSRSSSSYRSSARYSSSSSSFRSEGPTGGAADPLDPLFEPFLDAAGPHSLFTEEGAGAPLCLPSFSRHRRESYGYSSSTEAGLTGRPASLGEMRSGLLQEEDSYYMSADVSQFEPQDVVLIAFNHNIVIHAEKVLEDGSVSNTFTHKSVLPDDVDPLSVSGTLTPEGMLVISVRRSATTP